MAKLQIFKDTFDPLLIELTDKDGNKKTLTQQSPITPKVMGKIEDILKNAESNTIDKVIEQLILIFGESKNFWNDFSVKVLNQILEFVAEELKKK